MEKYAILTIIVYSSKSNYEVGEEDEGECRTRERAMKHFLLLRSV